MDDRNVTMEGVSPALWARMAEVVDAFQATKRRGD
jgi:hypothetical protein